MTMRSQHDVVTFQLTVITLKSKTFLFLTADSTQNGWNQILLVQLLTHWIYFVFKLSLLNLIVHLVREYLLCSYNFYCHLILICTGLFEMSCLLYHVPVLLLLNCLDVWNVLCHEPSHWNLYSSRAEVVYELYEFKVALKQRSWRRN